MQQSISITFNDIPHSDAVEQHIKEKAAKLDQYFQGIIACDVALSLAQKNQQQGKLHHVNLKVSIPGKELAATHNGDENLYKAIQDAFDNMAEQLQRHAQQLHGKVKTHAETIQGEIARLFDYDEFGFINGIDGNEYYFNASNVKSNHFKDLKIGQLVHFSPDVGSEGLMAKSVHARKEKE